MGKPMHSTTATHFQTSRAGGHHYEACDLACPQRATYAERETHASTIVYEPKAHPAG